MENAMLPGVRAGSANITQKIILLRFIFGSAK